MDYKDDAFSVLNIIFDSNILSKDHSFIMNDIAENEDDFSNKNKKNIFSERYHTIHAPIYTKIGVLNCEVNIFYQYKFNFFSRPFLKLIKKIDFKIILNNISNYSGNYHLILYFNKKYYLKLINTQSKKIIIKKNSKRLDVILEPFRALFLTVEELDMLNVNDFTALCDGWLETYQLIDY